MTDIITTFINDAVQSDFFAGGLALGAFGMAAALLRLVFFALYRFIQRRIWVSLTLDNCSPAYRHFCIWMEHHQILSSAKHIRMTDGRWAGGTKGYAPAPGRHWFRQAGRLCRFERNIQEKTKIGSSHDQRPMEVIRITMLFGRLATILDWIAAGKSIAQTKDRIGPGLHIHKGDYWDCIGDVPGRSIDSVMVDDDRITRLRADMRWFYGAADWYAQRGVPWRRGYLIYGPPGTGKSSLIRALATDLRLDIATLDVGRSDLSDEALREAMISAPRRAIIAIEDIDAIFVNRQEGDKKSGVSFSGLLNAIDGVAAQEGRALIMTTNHREKLDPALIRPGRADTHLELGLINAATATRLFRRFFPDDEEHAQLFAAALGRNQYSPAAVQGWLLGHWDDPVSAATAAGLISEPTVLAAE